jgi:thiol-disulfide isomerase/thioredoxin
MKKNIFILFFLMVISSQGQQAIVSKKSGSLSVVFFMAVDCPITQKYMNTIREILDRYGGKVQFVGYFPAGLSKNDVSTFREEYKIPENLKLLGDANHALTNKLNAKVTPEVFVLEGDAIVYHGAVDNWFYKLGRNRRAVTEHYLINAIDNSLAGTKTKLSKTEAIGCFIQRTEVKEHQHHQ